MSKSLTIFISFFLSAQLFAQEKGFLRGNIADGDFGGPMIGATVTVDELPGVGAATDFDGNYSLPLDPGVYTVQVSFISYASQSYPGIEIKAGEVTIIDAVMQSAIAELAGVEVVAEVRRNSEVAMLMDMKNATTVSDGLSAQSFRKIGDSDLSGAIKRVTGVTVQNGKYVYVRGLGDRYTKTTLNGMALPGLDPDANAVQIDIFPTSILENVSVAKTFSPDLDGDFTGGLVNVVTKNFPDEKTTQIRLGATFIPGMHFNPDFILYDRKATAFTGFDFGQRALQFDPIRNKTIPDPVLGDPLQEEITRSFSPQLSVKNKTAYPNGSFSFIHGNQMNKENGATIGYNFVLNYSNESVFYTDFESNDYLKDNNRSVNSLFKQVARVGDVGKNNVLWSALASGAYKKDNHSVALTLLNSQSAETSASRRINQDFNQNQATLMEDVLTYSQRQLSTGILNGKHKFGRVELNWANALSYSRVYDPDFRESRISITDGDTTLSTGNGSGLFRFWRDLQEFNNSTKIDLKVQVAEKAYVKFGGLATLKSREFNTYSYKHTRRNLNDISIDPDWYLQDENIWSPELAGGGNTEGTYTIGTYQPANSYDARQTLFTGYALMNHRLATFIKLNYGVRVEQTAMYYTGRNNSGSEQYRDEKTLDNLNFLPSANLVFELSEKMNLRAGASQTLARPSFKEKSIAQIYDPITKRTFIGNLDLEQTSINNFDLRYEFFMSSKELFAVSLFYKQFDGHIELVSFATAPDNLKPRNSGSAETYGVEVELRKSVPGVETGFFSKLFLSTNFSLVQSRVDMNTVLVNNTGLTEFELRTNNLRDGEVLGQYRAMSGQSPYAVNVGLSYEDAESQSSVSIAYNVQGEQLTIIASGRVPDIYTVPFHSLNFNAYKNFGKDFRSRVTLGLSNILNDDRTLVYSSYGAEDGIYTSYKPGVGISLKYQFTF
ncbi:MAG: TonB-dependent receptor [Flavobacteriales bacterium]|nr:TonB-dependent receptor [Flavobacteriales bacterium]